MKMARIFTRIETEEDRILHNDILADVLQIIEGKEKQFFRGMAEFVLYPHRKTKKRFLFRLVELVFQIGHQKGQ
jgi:hypothetical protein